jgi:CHAT domain
MSDYVAAAFEAGIERGVRASMIDALPAHERVKQMVREASEPQDHLAAAEQLGFAYQIAQKHEYMGEQFDILDVLGSIYAHYPSSIDSDMASIQASKLMRRAARGFVSIGDMPRAAIALTNAAVALMEKSDISDSEFTMIKKFLDFGFQHKRPGTVDWGYSEAALGMYYAELRTGSRSERIANLQKSSEAHGRALEIFARYGEVVSVTAQTMVSKVERDLYRERRAQRIADTFLEHVTELPESAQRWAPDMPNMMAENIMTNPAVYGFETAPDWLSEIINAPPSNEDTEMLQTARDRLVDAIANDAGSDYTALLECRWQAAEIDWNLLPAGEAYQDFLTLITTYAGDFSPEQFIRRGSRVIGMARYVGEQPPVQLLLDIAAAFGRISEHRDAKRLEVFLRKNPAHMRFVACELCGHGLWDDAISVIESSRLLLYAKHAQESRECDLPSTDPSEAPSWVYVTHSPRGTYVILGREDDQGSASGIFLADIDGADLSDLHFSFADESVGLMHAQAGGMSSHLTAATARAFEILEPLSQAIRGLVPEDRGICLIIGGLYVTLPVSAALTMDYSGYYPYVVVVPSRTHTVSRRYSLALNENVVATAMSVPIASWIPDMPVLAYSDHEAMALEGFLSATGAQTSVITQARIADFEAAFQHSNLVHFSGHSVGMPFQPEYASMLFQDGPYSVSSILEHSPERNLLLATISSCQSGHQSTTVLGDEFLGVNTALLNRGCRFTLSTLWPIFDVVSYVVTSRFYSALARESDVHIESLYRCLTDTQLWVRTSTAAEISDFFRTNDLKIPTMLETSPVDSVPYAHPRVWAAYYLSSRCL